jgi:hypothetical protein
VAFFVVYKTQKMREKIKLTVYDIIAIISGIGLIGWIISDFFGGMILFMIAYSVIVIPILLLYIFSFFDTILSLIRKGKMISRVKLIVHMTIFLVIAMLNIYHSELFKSEKIMSAVLNDDLYSYRLIFRKNGVVENQVNGMLGYSKTYFGEYKIEEKLIIFSKKPYENNFIPDTLLIDKEENAIFLSKKTDNKKEWLNHFKIE